MSLKLESAPKPVANQVESPILCLHGRRVAPPVFENILSFLETRRDGPNIALTCKAWRQLNSKCTLACLDNVVFTRIAARVKEVLGKIRAGPDSFTPERCVAACRMRFERVRTIDLSEVSRDQAFGNFADFTALIPLFFQTFPRCASFTYPSLDENWYPLQGQSAERHARSDQSLKAAFGSLPARESLTTVDMSHVFMRAETIFSFVPKNSHLTSLTLRPDAILGDRDGEMDESVRQVQSIGCKLLALRRLEIRTHLGDNLPQSLLYHILQGLPALEILSLVNGQTDEQDVDEPIFLRFTSEPGQDADVIAKNKGLKRVEFTECHIDQGLIQLFERSCHTPPQLSFNNCSFSKRLKFTMQLLRTTPQ